jgi:hypothetical protein
MNLVIPVACALIILSLLCKPLRRFNRTDSITKRRIPYGERIYRCKKCFSAYNNESLSKIFHGNGERCLECDCDLNRYGVHLG